LNPGPVPRCPHQRALAISLALINHIFANKADFFHFLSFLKEYIPLSLPSTLNASSEVKRVPTNMPD
jgi:hypothetical protein